MIHLEHVTKAFKGAPAVHDLTLQVMPGEIFGLLGANGAGKSTTIQMLLGFLLPDTGQIVVHETDVCRYPAKARASTGYIPENVNLYPFLSGLENLDYFCRLAGLRYTQVELTGFLTTCGLQPDAHARRVSGYSKGMRQKVGIAIAYAKKARVYLLDEPASGLDPLASNELSVLLKKLSADGASILMASHDLFRVREVCHRIGILKQGRLVKELRSEEVTAAQLEQIYLQFMKS